MEKELNLEEFHLTENGLDMKLSGEPAKIFMAMLINLFEQNGGKNFLTTTMEGQGKRYSITITNLNGNDSPAEKLQRLEEQNRELVTLLRDIEWNGVSIKYINEYGCPVCGEREEDGHDLGCEMAKQLDKAKGIGE